MDENHPQPYGVGDVAIDGSSSDQFNQEVGAEYVLRNWKAQKVAGTQGIHKEEYMKQHITPNDLAQLSQEQREKLIEWFKSKDYFPQFTQPTMMLESFDTLFARVLGIGQMIEFLQENWNDWYMSYQDTTCNWYVRLGYLPDIEKPRLEYCEEELTDALWEAVKEIL